MGPRAWHRQATASSASQGPSQVLNFELIWMTCVKQAPLLDLIVPLIIFCAPFHFLPILLLLSITPLPFHSLGDQMTLGLGSTLPLSVNANLYSHPFICTLGPPFSLSFHFNTGFCTFQRAGAPNWIHHNLLLMGLPSIAPLKPSLTY